MLIFKNEVQGIALWDNLVEEVHQSCDVLYQGISQDIIVSISMYPLDKLRGKKGITSYSTPIEVHIFVDSFITKEHMYIKWFQRVLCHEFAHVHQMINNEYIIIPEDNYLLCYKGIKYTYQELSEIVTGIQPCPWELDADEHGKALYNQYFRGEII